jgi:hypothetical protein
MRDVRFRAAFIRRSPARAWHPKDWDYAQPSQAIARRPLLPNLQAEIAAVVDAAMRAALNTG